MLRVPRCLLCQPEVRIVTNQDSIRRTVTNYPDSWVFHGVSSTDGVELRPAICRLDRLMLSQMLARAEGVYYNWGSDISGVYGGGSANGDWYIAGEGWSVANF
jgi:hypothetical protein